MKKLLLVLVVFALSFAIYTQYERTNLRVTGYKLKTEKISENIRIVQLSDLHSMNFGEDNEKLIKKTKDLNPDIIALTGDLIDFKDKNLDAVRPLIEGLAGYDMYYVSGNHERWSDIDADLRRLLADNGVKILSDEWVNYGDDIVVMGIEDPEYSNKTYADKVINEMVKDTEGKYRLLLSHRPEITESFTDVDLVLSGHTHGGQVRVPFIGSIIAPSQGFFPKFDKGLYDFGETKLIISTGLGTSVLPVRAFNPPEIVVIDLER